LTNSGSFNRCWPELERLLGEVVSAPASGDTPARNDRDVLDEVLQHVRTLAQNIRADEREDPVLKPRDLDGPAATFVPKTSEVSHPGVLKGDK
jgi:hypothetical protein